MRGRIPVLVVVVLGLVAAACGGQDGSTAGPSLEIGSVPQSVEGNVVRLPVTVEGVEIVAPDGDTSGGSGHFHVFVDREPVEEGEVIPRERGVVHSAENPIAIYGLQPGEHTFQVVLGNGIHERIHGDVDDSVTVEVEGPSVQGSAPATAEAGEDVRVELTSQGVEIRKPDGDRSGESGHYHVFVDPAEPPVAGMVVPAAVENKIFHTTEPSVTISALEAGEHVIWVALGDGTHTLFEPAVLDRLTVTVGPAASPQAPAASPG